MSQPTLYDRIGGAEAVAELTDEFYSRVLDDEVLAPFFEHSSIDKLRLMQREFFSAALDGPVHYTGKPLPEAHAGRGIESTHFSRFVGHLLDTLGRFELSERERRDIIERIKTYHGEVVGVVGEAG